MSSQTLFETLFQESHFRGLTRSDVQKFLFFRPASSLFDENRQCGSEKLQHQMHFNHENTSNGESPDREHTAKDDIRKGYIDTCLPNNAGNT